MLFYFRDIEGVLKSANGTEYGLASGVFTKDLSKVCFVQKLLSKCLFLKMGLILFPYCDLHVLFSRLSVSLTVWMQALAL